MNNQMKKGVIITALDAFDKKAANLAQICRDASDDDVIHAALYAATDGTGDLAKRDLQNKRFKTLRTTLIRERKVSVKWNGKAREFYIDLPNPRTNKNDETEKLPSTAPEIEGKAKTDTETGNRSKPSATLSKAEDKVAALTEGRSKADVMASIARQMQRAGISLDELAGYMAEGDKVAA